MKSRRRFFAFAGLGALFAALAGKALLAPPVLVPLRHTSRVSVAKCRERYHVDFTDDAAVQRFTHGLDYRRMSIVMGWEQHAFLALGEREELACILDAGGQWFLTQHMQTAPERRPRHRGVCIGRGSDIHEVQLIRLVREQGLVIGINTCTRKRARGCLATRSANVGHRDDL